MRAVHWPRTLSRIVCGCALCVTACGNSSSRPREQDPAPAVTAKARRAAGRARSVASEQWRTRLFSYVDGQLSLAQVVRSFAERPEDKERLLALLTDLPDGAPELPAVNCIVGVLATTDAHVVRSLLRVISDRREGKAAARGLAILARVTWTPEGHEALVGRALRLSLGSSDAVARRQALIVLASLEPDCGIGAHELMWAMRDTDPAIRSALAACAKRDHVWTEALEALACDASPEVRASAVAAVGRLLPWEHTPTQIVWRAGDDSDARVRSAAVAAAARVDPKSRDLAVELVTRQLGDPDEGVRSRALSSIRQLHASDAASGETLARLVLSSPRCREGALLALADQGPAAREYVGLAIGAAQDQDAAVRQAAYRAIAAMTEGTAATHAVALGVSDPDPLVREEVARSFRAPDSVAVMALVDLVGDRHFRVRDVALDSIRAAGAAAIPVLEGALSDASSQRRVSAIEALALLHPSDLVGKLAPMVRDASPDVRRAALQSLSQEPALPSPLEGVLRALVTESTSPGRVAAIQCMARLERLSEASVCSLRGAMKHSDAATARAAAEVLLDADPQGASRRLQELAIAGDVGSADLLAAAAMRFDPARDALIECLESQSQCVCAVALDGLAAMGVRAAVASTRLRGLDPRLWGGTCQCIRGPHDAAAAHLRALSALAQEPVVPRAGGVPHGGK